MCFEGLFVQWMTLLVAAEDSRQSESLLGLEMSNENTSFSLLEFENSCEISIQADKNIALFAGKTWKENPVLGVWQQWAS